MLLRFFILSCIALLAMAPVGLRASELRVFAAASL
jgi:ABC-type molybdate transport system substrate-binding protein